MKIGAIEAKPGSKAFGFFKTGETHGGFDVHIPLHIVAGATPGPTLVVHSGLSGLEIEPAMILPHIAEELDPGSMKGTLVLVPLMNTSGFEFEQINAVWDDKNLNELGRGQADGTVSERMVAQYYQNVLAHADALVEIHTGMQWGYYRYAGVYHTGAPARSQALAEALGLPQVLLGQPADQSMAFEVAQDGKAVVSAWIGGGPGLRDYRDEDMARVRNAVLNAMRHLGMLGGAIEGIDGSTTTLRCHTVLGLPEARGLTFMDKRKRGQSVAAGEAIGIVRHPFTGATVQTITAPRAGVMLHAGASWPVQPEGSTVAILGDPV